MPEVLKKGDIAPEFHALDQDGNTITLSQYKGKKIILYFYPKDDTPGCTKEACAFRDSYQAFERLGVKILGVGIGDQKSHKKFVDKYSLPFILLVDNDHDISSKYGAWVEKNMYGRKYMGIKRVTFLIDERGVVEDIFLKVSPTQHAEELLSLLKP